MYTDDIIKRQDWIRVDNQFNIIHKSCFNKNTKNVEILLKGKTFTVESLK